MAKHIKMKSGKTPLSIILLSALVACFVDLKAINWALVYGGFVGEGLMNLLYPFVIGAIAIMAFFTRGYGRRIKPPLVIILLYLLLSYYLTILFIGAPNVSLPMFFALTIAAVIIPSITTIDAKCFIRAMMILPSFAILRLDKVFATTKEWYTYISMDASYGFLIPVSASIIYMYFYLKQDKKWTKAIMLVVSLINMVFLFMLITRGSRAPLLCLFLLLVFVFIFKISDKGKGVAVRKGRLKLFLLTVVVVLLLTPFFISLLDLFLQKFGIDSYALIKIVDLASEDNLSNGRSNINTLTWNLIFDSPIFGHGLDRYNADTDLLYPHNFILQLLYDGGVVYLFIILAPVFYGLKKVYKNCMKDEFVIMTLLFFSTVPGAMFSLSIYNNGALWLFFGSCLTTTFVLKKQRIKDI